MVRYKYVIIMILFAGYICLYSMTGCSDSNSGKEIKRSEVEKNILKNERNFFKLIYHFNSMLPKDKKQIVRFGIANDDRLILTVLPLDEPLTQENDYLGGEDLQLDSMKMDSILGYLKWSRKEVILLKNLLSKTDCKWIRSTEICGNPVEVHYKESGLGSFSYLIFEEPLNDSLIKIQGEPMGEKELKDRIVISYHSSL